MHPIASGWRCLTVAYLEFVHSVQHNWVGVRTVARIAASVLHFGIQRWAGQVTPYNQFEEPTLAAMCHIRAPAEVVGLA